MTAFPVEAMYEQFRMPEVLCALPNRRCYGRRLRTSTVKKGKYLPTAWWEFIDRNFEIYLAPFVHINDAEAREYDIDQYLRLQMMNVPDGKCQIEPHTQSRFNMANVEVAMKFFEQLVTCLVEKGQLEISQIKILTFCNAQKRRMINALVDLGKELKLTANELADVVHTSDSFQGQEADVVILDTPVCSYTGHGTLGHVGDELNFNVAATRAKECLFVIGNLRILDSEIIAEQERVEFVVDLLQTLRKQGSYKDFTSTARPEKIVGAKFDHEVQKGDEEEDMEGETAVESVGSGLGKLILGAIP
jgi:superfamily I DNA and/or RNA helicase